MADDLLSPPIEIGLSQLRRRLRELLADFESKSGYALVGLFDLWCNYEAESKRQELWYVGVAHAIRELLEAFYPGGREDISVEVKKSFDVELPQVQVPSRFASRLIINRETSTIEWKGVLNPSILNQIQGLNESFVFKYACWLLYCEAKKKSNRDKVRTILKGTDPLSENPSKRESFIDQYLELQKFFTKVCHSKGESQGFLNEWDLRIKEVEIVIASVIGEQSSIIEKVQEFLKSESPSVGALKRLDVLLGQTATYNFFLDRIDASWLDFLAKEGWFSVLPEFIKEKDRITSCAWAASRYLVRIAGDAPGRVFEIISTFKFTKDTDAWVLCDTIKCLQSIADKVDISPLLKRLVKEKWLQYDIVHSVSMEAVELWQKLIRAGQFKNAGILLEGLLDFDQDLNDPDGRCKPYLDEYYLRQVLDELQNVKPTRELSFIINALSRKLDSVIKARETKYDDESKEIRIRAFQLYTHKKLMQPILELCIQKYCTCSRNENDTPLIQELTSFLSSITDDEERECIRSCVIMDNRATLNGEVQKLLLSDALYSLNIGKQIAKRLSNIYPELTESEKSQLLTKIENGHPEYKEEELADYWRSKYIRKIWDYLDDNKRQQFGKFAPKGEPDLDEEEVTTTWVGPTSPFSPDDLKITSVEDALEYFKSWKPAKEWLGDSVAGLARTLGEVVSQNPIKFIDHAEKFFDSKVDPTYLCHFISGVRQAIRNKEKFDVKPMILLSLRICEAARNNQLPELSKREALSVGWAGVLQSIAELLEAIFSFNLLPYDEELLPSLWSILSVVSQFPDPSDENLIFYREHGTEPSHVALNTTQGWGYRACISFLLWLKRNKSSKLSEQTSRITQQIIEQGKSNFWVSYIAGEFLPWIYDLDRSAGQEIISKIMNSNDSACAFAAWDGYVRGRFWKPVYVELEPSLDNFLNNLSGYTPPWKDRHNVVHDVGDRMAVAYLFQWTSEVDKKLQLFFDTQDLTARAGIVSFIGTTFLQKRERDESKGDLPSVDRLLEFWDWRLSVSSDVQELKEFGWWVESDYLPRKKMLDRLLSTLKKSSGQIDPLMRVSEVLIESFEQHRVEVLEAFLLIVEGGEVQRIIIEFRDGSLKPLIVAGKASSDPKEKSLAKNLKNALLKFGINEYL